MQKQYHYKRTRLTEGMLLLFMIEMTGIAFVVATSFLMAEESADFLRLVHIGIMAVSTLICLIFALPHLKNGKEVFEYKCDGVWVSCNSPGAYLLDYRINMNDINKPVDFAGH